MQSNHAKCSKYHAKWQILVPNCCKYKANGTRKDAQKNPKPEAKKNPKTILNPFLLRKDMMTQRFFKLRNPQRWAHKPPWRVPWLPKGLRTWVWDCLKNGQTSNIFFRVYYHDVSYFPLQQCCFFEWFWIIHQTHLCFDVHAKFRIEWWNAISVKATSFLETQRQWLFKRTHVLYFLVNFLGNKMRERTPGRN